MSRTAQNPSRGNSTVVLAIVSSILKCNCAWNLLFRFSQLIPNVTRIKLNIQEITTDYHKETGYCRYSWLRLYRTRPMTFVFSPSRFAAPVCGHRMSTRLNISCQAKSIQLYRPLRIVLFLPLSSCWEAAPKLGHAGARLTVVKTGLNWLNGTNHSSSNIYTSHFAHHFMNFATTKRQ